MEEKLKKAKEASKKLAYISTEVKNKALLNISESLIRGKERIIDANSKDVEEAKKAGIPDAMLDRLILNGERIEGMAKGVRDIAALPDPVGEVFDMRTLPNGLVVGKKRVPIGVIGAIYEARPNVTVDISALCIKAGNSVVLRGGREALNSNKVLADIIRKSIGEAGVPEDSVQFIDDPSRELVLRMLKAKEYIDLMIPRGGAEFIKFVLENAEMPVVAGGIGVCHTYVDEDADIDKAVRIVYNAKVQRPTVCNALDCILVHKNIAEKALPPIGKELAKAGVEMRCDERSYDILSKLENLKVIRATEDDWGKEFLSLRAAVKVVDSIDEAIEHISKYGSGHSEAIITENYGNAMKFLDEVDAACVYVNASTRFTDGGEFGLGAEVGISTQKLHARGPMGLKEITTYKWIIFGNGQVRR